MKSESCSIVSNSLLLHGLHSPRNSPGQNTGVGSLSVLQGIFPTQGSNLGLPHCRQMLYCLSHQRSPQIERNESCSVMLDSLRPHVLYSPGILQARILEWVASPFSRGSSQPRDWTHISYNEGRFFSSWATREALEIVNLNEMHVHVHIRHRVRGKTIFLVCLRYNTK